MQGYSEASRRWAESYAKSFGRVRVGTHPLIYLVTVLNIEEGRVLHDRTWGWHPTLEEAVECIKKNDGDIYENGSYNYALVEEMPAGSLAICEQEHWFKVIPYREPGAHSVKSYQVEFCEKPEGFKGVVNFGMG